MTLVVAIPYRAGLVVASDSRHTLQNVFCDGVEKLLEPQRVSRLIIGVTGRRGFYPLAIAAARDPCAYARETPRDFDMGLVARDYVDENGCADLAEFNIVGLAEHCARALQQYFVAKPRVAPISSSCIFLSGYDYVRHRSILRSFEVNANGQLSYTLRLNEVCGHDDKAEPFVFGEGDYVRVQVLPFLGEYDVSAATKRQLGRFPEVAFTEIGATSLNDAVSVAKDLIEVASARSEIVAAQSGIGGPVDVRYVGRRLRPQRHT